MSITKEVLYRLIIEENKSYSEIGRMFSVTGAAIKKRARILGINLPRRRKINPKENFSHPQRRMQKEKLSYVYKCDEELFKKYVKESFTWKELGQKLGYKCKVLSINIKNDIEERCEKLGMSLNSSLIKKNDILDKTKGELKERRCNYQSYRSSIRKSAYEIFFNNCTDKKCVICGYDKHIEVAHIKAVSEFDDNTLISEINSIDNLIALCPNHHWEFDHGMFKI